MTKVIISENCGNSPKNTFVIRLTTALAKGETKYLLSHVTGDIRWNIVGERVIEGKDIFAGALAKAEPVQTLTIKHVATHGKAGAVDGTMKMKSGKTYAFCDFYDFWNAKGEDVKEITTYVIEIT